MADEDEGWMFDVQGVVRVSPDPDDAEDGVTYAVTFEVNGPNASAEVEIYVDDAPDPSQIIIMAMSQLHLALAAWARITAGRRIANDAGAPG